MNKQADLSKASWGKSSYSSGDRDCVEVAFANATTGIRDSKIPHGPQLAVTAGAFAMFLSGLKAGRPGRTA